MNLNLGLESLNGSARGAVVPFTPASAIEMQNASEAITNLMASLENYYDAARNAMLVKKAVKKYGKTQSIVALVLLLLSPSPWKVSGRRPRISSGRSGPRSRSGGDASGECSSALKTDYVILSLRSQIKHW